MKYCPNCAEQNYDESAVCYACGKPLPYSAPPAEDEFPTQPLHVQPHHTQARPAQAQPAFPPPQVPYDPNYQTQGYAPNPYPPGYPQQGGYPQQPGYQQPGYQQPGYQQPGYPPPPAPPQSSRRRYWPALALGGVVMFLCLCALSIWLVTDATSRGVAGLGAGFSTQVAGVFPGQADEATPDPGVVLVPDPILEPSPWPTFTPEPLLPTSPPVEPTLAPLPEATQPVVAQPDLSEKLLSPECKTSLDELGRMGGEVSSEPFKLLDAAWRDQFETAQAAVKAYCGTIDSASPVPQRLEAVQQNLAQANTAFDEANRLWKEAIDSRDPVKVFEAAGQFQQATQYLNLAITELRKVVQ